MGYWSQSQASSLLWRCSLCELLSHLEWTDNNAGNALRLPCDWGSVTMVIRQLNPLVRVNGTLPAEASQNEGHDAGYVHSFIHSFIIPCACLKTQWWTTRGIDAFQRRRFKPRPSPLLLHMFSLLSVSFLWVHPPSKKTCISGGLYSPSSPPSYAWFEYDWFLYPFVS